VADVAPGHGRRRDADVRALALGRAGRALALHLLARPHGEAEAHLLVVLRDQRLDGAPGDVPAAVVRARDVVRDHALRAVEGDEQVGGDDRGGDGDAAAGAVAADAHLLPGA